MKANGVVLCGILALLITLVCLLSGCAEAMSIDAHKLEVYILRKSDESNEFIMDKTPIFTGNEIESYEWDTHTIIFNSEFILSMEKKNLKEEDEILLGGSTILDVYYPDQFALFLEGEELYRGYLAPPVYSSFLPMGPRIANSENGIVIMCIDGKLDTRNDDRLKDFLEKNHLRK
ncbi:hypothetical protein RI065_09720 [Mycoplasmatota bacterium zrk1]